LAATSGGQAAVIYTVSLTNALEPSVVLTTTTGAARPASFGTATFTFNDTFTSLSFTATITNIDFTGTQTADVNDNLTNAHIHASDTLVPNSLNTAPVVWGFIGAPFNDNNPNDAVVTPFSTGVGGTVSGKWDPPEGNGTTLAIQMPNLLAGRAYINFHTVQNGGGEIRAFLEPVPEPSSVVLLGLGTLAIVGCGVRARMRTR